MEKHLLYAEINWIAIEDALQITGRVRHNDWEPYFFIIIFCNVRT